jgi:hypothetical protein
MISMTGLAGIPGIAVLPMCSMGPASHGFNTASSKACSATNLAGQPGSYSTISMAASVFSVSFDGRITSLASTMH